MSKNHPSLDLMLDDMMIRFDHWTDRMWEVEVGFTRTAYLNCAVMLARLAVLDKPSQEALVELKKLRAKFQAYRLILNRHAVGEPKDW